MFPSLNPGVGNDVATRVARTADNPAAATVKDGHDGYHRFLDGLVPFTRAWGLLTATGESGFTFFLNELIFGSCFGSQITITDY